MKKTTLINKKTKGIILEYVEHMIKNNKNIVIIDKNEEYLGHFDNQLKDYNKVILNLRNNEKSNNYNPFLYAYKLYKEDNYDKAIMIIEHTIRCIFNNEENKDQILVNMATDLCVSLMLILLETINNEKQLNFRSLFLALDAVLNYDKVTEYYSKINKFSPIYVCGSSIIFSEIDIKTNIVNFAKQQIEKLNFELLSTTNFEIKENKNIFFILLDEYNNSIGNMLLYELHKKELNIDFLLDNIDYINYLECLEEQIEEPFNNIIIATSNLEYLKIKYTFLDKVEETIDAKDIKIIEAKQNKIKLPTIDNNNSFFSLKEYLELQSNKTY